jgi:hypothetical protein
MKLILTHNIVNIKTGLKNYFPLIRDWAEERYL